MVRVKERKAEKVGEFVVGGRVSVVGWREDEAMVADSDGKIWIVRGEGALVEIVKSEEDCKVWMIDWHTHDQVAIIVEQEGKVLATNYKV